MGIDQQTDTRGTSRLPLEAHGRPHGSFYHCHFGMQPLSHLHASVCHEDCAVEVDVHQGARLRGAARSKPVDVDRRPRGRVGSDRLVRHDVNQPWQGLMW